MYTLPFVTGPCLVILGMVIRYAIGKRRFNRRNQVGMELFPSYGQAIVTRMAEALGRIIGALLVFVGIVLLLARTI
jgi:hypothetical protein